MPTKKYKVSSQLVEIDVGAIEVPEWARKISREYLQESIEERGVIVPIVVAKLREGKEVRYILVDGYGRLELAKKKGLKTIPARLVEVEHVDDPILLSIELEQTREPWDLQYTLYIIEELILRGFSKQKIAEILKIPRSKIYRLLYIRDFPPEIKKAFMDGEIPLRYAEKIHEIIKKVGADKFVEEYNYFRSSTSSAREAIDDAIEILENEIEVEEREKKMEKEIQEEKGETPSVPTGTEGKYVPASELEIPQEEVEEVTVEVPEEEEVERIEPEKMVPEKEEKIEEERKEDYLITDPNIADAITDLITAINNIKQRIQEAYEETAHKNKAWAYALMMIAAHMNDSLAWLNKFEIRVGGE